MTGNVVLLGFARPGRRRSPPRAGAGARRLIVVVVLALAMGVQSAVARRIAVPDVATIVLTRTLSALGAQGAARSTAAWTAR